MAVSYKKLWHLLIDKDMKKKVLQEAANLTSHAMRKLSHDKVDDIMDVIELNDKAQ